MTNFLIDFIDSATDAEITAYFSEHGCTLITMFDKLARTCHVQSAIVPPMTALTTLVQDDDATDISLLSVIPVIQEPIPASVTITTTDTKNWWKSYSLRSFDFAETNATIPVYGDNTNVYLVDSGINISHPEFTNKNIELLYSVTGEYSDTSGHGTALGSLIVGNTCGLTNTCLKVVKIFDVTRPIRQSDLLYAFNAIINDTLVSPNKVSIVNLSWSIARNSYIEDKILLLIQAGVAVVVSAGNAGLPIGDVTPAAMAEVITIGSYGQNFIPSDFSNYAASSVSLTLNACNSGELDSWAPGEQIWSAMVDGSYGFVNGTSAAAAIYSASIAYNAGRYMFSNNDLGPHRRNSNNVIVNRLITNTDRSSILDLSDPRYATSQNKICTYLNNWDHILPATSILPGKMVIAPGIIKTRVLFDTTMTASYEILTTLPPWAQIDRGVLFLTPVDEPNNPTGVDIYELPYRVNFTDGTQAESNITVVLVGTSFNADTLAANDPLIEITMQVLCGGRFTCTGQCTTGQGSQAVCIPYKAFSYCGCISP